MNRYLVVLEPAAGNWAAFSPDLPGCVATAATREKVVDEMRAAVAFHLEGLKAEGLPVREPTSSAEYLSVPA